MNRFTLWGQLPRIVTSAVRFALPLLGACASGIAQSKTPEHCLPRDPSISASHIAFGCGGDIWIADRDGAHLRRLTDGGHEGSPRLSPDGTEVAYTEYNDSDGYRGNVYLVPVAGGEPRQLTYHPADIGVVGWTPDGKQVLFVSARASFTAFGDENRQLFTVPVSGGYATAVPLSRASEGSYSPDGRRIAYVPGVQWQHAQDAWKRYRGGQTQPIWIANLADSGIEAKIPRTNSNDFNPMWVGDSIYFLSDRDGPVTLFAYDLRSHQVRRLLKNSGLDLKSASATSDAIIYEQFGSLHLLDIRSDTNSLLKVSPVADFPELEPHWRKVESSQLRFSGISPSGDHVVFGAFGQLFTVSSGGEIHNMTRSKGSVERDPAWSPDGRSLAYFSDESGEYALHIRNMDNSGTVRKISLDDPGSFYFSPVWSPDSRKIAYTDKRLNYWYVDLDTGARVLLDTDRYVEAEHDPQMSWSPDSRWIAYAKQLNSHLRAIYLYSVERGKSYQITDGMSDALYPAFDKSGKYLYFTASTDVALSRDKWEMSGIEHPVTRSVYAALLKKGLVSPLASGGNEANSGQAQEQSATGKPVQKTEIDIDDIAERTIALPIPARNYSGLFAGAPGIVYLLEGPPITNPSDARERASSAKVLKFDLGSRTTETIVDDVASFHLYGSRDEVTSFRLSYNGNRMLYRKQNAWFVAPTARPVDPRAPALSPLKLDSMAVYVHPRVEWKHLYEQVWRDEREFFYDPGLHGLNLKEVKRKYEHYLDHIATRDELNDLFREMLGNLTASHVFVSGGDIPDIPSAHTGLLGADYSVESGRYRFAQIYHGDPWNPAVRAPLVQPGASVQVGEYLLAVNGRDVDARTDIYSFFAGTAGKPTTLQVGSQPDRRGSRTVIVTPLDSEEVLRYYAWIEDNRRKVDEWSGGRVAYIHVPDTSGTGYRAFNRYFFAQAGKAAAIIDERYNHGGAMADYIVDILRQPLVGYATLRDGQDVTMPMQGIFGPKVMVINEMSGSGGDSLAYLFREERIGPLVGTRTWGGLIGTPLNPGDLMDGGVVTTPSHRLYDTRGVWIAENEGISPDITVEDDPKAERSGHDLQLEKAVQEVMKMLQENSPHPPQRPPYPSYQRPAPTPVASGSNGHY